MSREGEMTLRDAAVGKAPSGGRAAGGRGQKAPPLGPGRDLAVARVDGCPNDGYGHCLDAAKSSVIIHVGRRAS